jgi:dienelactone hydrolase
MRIDLIVSPCLLLMILVPLPARAQVVGRTWNFEQLLSPPRAAELQRVDQDWRQKSWVVDDVTPVGVTAVPMGRDHFEARLYTHTLNGARRCGVVVIPPGAARKSLAGLLDIGDVRWDYPDRDLSRGLYLARVFGSRAAEFGVVIPCARGMAIRIGEFRVEAEGDRRDAWEGMAEDAIAFLSAALSVTPEIDAERVGAYGYSRGGGVALIVGQRDTRIKAVLDFAGPTDWFSAMGRPGQNWPERLEQAYRDPALEPDTRESQYLDWFVRGRESLPLSTLRRRLAGASPLYFTNKLPPVQVHHGEDDRPVPVRNATAVRDRLQPGDESRRVFIYPGVGHKLDDTVAPTRAVEFLIQHLVRHGNDATR